MIKFRSKYLLLSFFLPIFAVDFIPSLKKMKYNRPFSPDRIESLRPNEIFVFGSNIRGQHLGGAALIANKYFWAQWGVGEGLTGQCYALPTMERGVDYVKTKVDNFLQCAREHPELTFLVTRIGCGIAGFKDEEIAPLFREALPMQNVHLPQSFVKIIAS